MEEAYELFHRVTEGGKLPMITSCSPGWINYIEKNHPDLLDNLSTCKSPHMMFGAIVKSYFAERNNIDPKKICVVSIMPCVAKKTEKERPQMINEEGMKDVDIVLTTRELGKLIRMFGIDFTNLKDEEFDQDLLGEYSGAGVIFGASGGVMEAALRTAADVLTGEDLVEVDYHNIRGERGLKEATIRLDDITMHVAVAHSMKLAEPLLKEIDEGKSPYTFIEIMGCPGGCVNGGGQSYIRASIRNSGFDYLTARAKALYDEDMSLPVRKSHKNSQIQKLYTDYLDMPNSPKAHHLLHTTYAKKEKYNR